MLYLCSLYFFEKFSNSIDPVGAWFKILGFKEVPRISGNLSSSFWIAMLSGSSYENCSLSNFPSKLFRKKSFQFTTFLNLFRPIKISLSKLSRLGSGTFFWDPTCCWLYQLAKVACIVVVIMCRDHCLPGVFLDIIPTYKTCTLGCCILRDSYKYLKKLT